MPVSEPLDDPKLNVELNNLPLPVRFGRWVRQQREARDLSLAEVAEIATEQAKLAGYTDRRISGSGWRHIELAHHVSRPGTRGGKPAVGAGRIHVVSERTCEWVSLGLNIPFPEVKQAAGYSPTTGYVSLDMNDMPATIFARYATLTIPNKRKVWDYISQLAAGTAGE